MIIQKLLRLWPLVRGRDRFFRMLPDATKRKLDDLKNPVLLKNGLRIFVSKGDDLSRWLRSYGAYELETSQIIREYSKPGQVFMDVGANMGLFSLEAAQILNLPVISFEPNPKIADLFTRSIKINGVEKNVRLFQVAVSDETCRATFVEHPSNKGGSALEVSGEAQEGSRYEVGVEKLDAYGLFQDHLAGLGLNVGLIKMDVEGAEERALRGMADLLKTHKPNIIVELVDSQLKLFGSGRKPVIAYLESLGFDLRVEFDGNGLFVPRAAE